MPVAQLGAPEVYRRWQPRGAPSCRDATGPPSCPAAHHHAPPPVAPQGAERAFAFSSGMAALAAVTRLLKAGDHVVAGDDLYGGTSRLLSRVVPSAGIEVSNVDTSDVE